MGSVTEGGLQGGDLLLFLQRLGRLWSVWKNFFFLAQWPGWDVRISPKEVGKKVLKENLVYCECWGVGGRRWSFLWGRFSLRSTGVKHLPCPQLLPSPGALPALLHQPPAPCWKHLCLCLSARAGNVLCPCQTSSPWQAAGCSTDPVVPVCWIICVNVFPPWRAGAHPVGLLDVMQHLPALEEHSEIDDGRDAGCIICDKDFSPWASQVLS